MAYQYLVYYEHIIRSKLKLSNPWSNTSGMGKQLSYHSQFRHVILVSIPVMVCHNSRYALILLKFLNITQIFLQKPNQN